MSNRRFTRFAKNVNNDGKLISSTLESTVTENSSDMALYDSSDLFPVSGSSVGQLGYDKEDNTVFVFNGSNWSPLDTILGVDSVNTIISFTSQQMTYDGIISESQWKMAHVDSIDSGGIFSKDPDANWAYYSNSSNMYFEGTTQEGRGFGTSPNYAQIFTTDSIEVSWEDRKYSGYISGILNRSFDELGELSHAIGFHEGAEFGNLQTGGMAFGLDIDSTSTIGKPYFIYNIQNRYNNNGSLSFNADSSISEDQLKQNDTFNIYWEHTPNVGMKVWWALRGGNGGTLVTDSGDYELYIDYTYPDGDHPSNNTSRWGLGAKFGSGGTAGNVAWIFHDLILAEGHIYSGNPAVREYMWDSSELPDNTIVFP